ncbi:hypothetical protein [Bacillus phage BC-T25]|nr:hypothetical protein [Bacillus phage BC-T25]
MTIIHSENGILNGEGSGLIVEFINRYESIHGTWKAYEFYTSEEITFQTFDSAGNLHDEVSSTIFRLEIGEGYEAVLIANHDEYCVHEDVSYAFDVDKIVSQMKEIESSIPDVQEDYNELNEEDEEGDEY